MKKHCETIFTAVCIALALFFAGSPAFAGEKSEDIPLPLRTALYKAQQLFEKNEFQKGIAILEEFKGSGKDGADSHAVDFWTGNAYLQTGKLENAAKSYEGAVGKNSDFSAARLNLAKCLFDLGRFEKAAEEFVRGYEASSERDPEILYYAAASYISADRPGKAVPVLERLVALDSPKAKVEWKETLVHALMADGKPTRAIPFMEELTKVFTGDKKAQWLENLLYQYLALDMKSKALSLAERLTEEHPSEPKWWKTLAQIHLSGNRERQALVAMTVYGYLAPPDEKEKKLLADLNLMLGIPRKAAALYETLQSSSGSNELVEKIAQCHQMAGQREKALDWIERGLKNGQTYDLLMLKGHILYETKRYGEAVSAFEAAANKNGKDPGRPWLMIGYSAWLDQDLNKAKGAFEKAAAYKRHEKDAVANIERIDRILNSKS